MLIRGGHNISPARIEELAAGHVGILRAAVLALPDARLGERICLAYVGRDGSEPDQREILAHLSAMGLSRYEMPEFMLCLAALPLMANGKVDKAVLLRQIDAGTLLPRIV